jgi:uncharacterized membrane protein
VAAVPKPKRDWGECVSLFVVLGLSFLLEDRYTLGGPVVTSSLLVCAAFAFVLSLATTLRGNRAGAGLAMIVAALVLGAGLIASMSNILYLVVYHANDIAGIRLLQSAAMIWVSNVVIFAVVYHWIGEGEFIFPRLPDDDARRKPLTFLDFLFLSFTTSTAFSPTDTPPLTTRVRMFMMFESAISLTTIAVAAARAVNILS